MGGVNATAVYAVGILFPVLGFIAVGLRFWVRKVKSVYLGIDDAASFLGLIFVTGCGACNVVGAATHTVGYHSPKQSTSAAYKESSKTFRIERQLEYAYILLMFPALGFIKLSILLFYRRIFQGKKFDITNWTAIFLMVGWLIAFQLANIFSCGVHPDAEWTSLEETEKQCFNVQAISIAGAVTEVAMDFFIILIPLPFIWGLQLPVERKIAVSAIFVIGGLSLAAGIVRMVVFAEAFKSAVVNSTILGVPGTDVVGLRSLGFFWLMVEVGISLVVSCLLPLWPLIQSPKRFFRSMKTSTFSSYQKNSTSNGNNSGSGRSDKNFKRLYDPADPHGALTSNLPFGTEAHVSDNEDVEMQPIRADEIGVAKSDGIGVRTDVFTSTEFVHKVQNPEKLNLGESNP